MTSRSILLTHWDPSYHNPNADPDCLADLALSALLHEKVVIRAIDLVMNEGIATKLHRSPEHLHLFQELVEHDCLTILTTNPQDYTDPATREIAAKMPITARADDQIGRSFAGIPWRPKPWQKQFCHDLDRIVTGHPSCLRLAKRPPTENLFARKLVKYLRDRRRYELEKMPQFADITDEIAEIFIRCCEEPGFFKTILRDVPNASTRQDFFRTEAYQCADQLKTEGIKHLAQSVYMALECEREKTGGRFGRKLWEPPFRFSSEDEGHAASEAVRRVELRPARRRLEISLRRGLGPALSATRGSESFKRIQATLLHWDPALPNAPKIEDICEALTDTFAYNAGRTMISADSVEEWTGYLLGLAGIAADTCAITLVPDISGIRVGPIVQELARNQCARLTGRMTKALRSATFAQSVSREISGALTVRSSTVNID